ncbi:YphA family membrane protein [Sediminibacillus halophilus]
MEGLLFYWICWLLWIVATFLLKKNTTRFYLSFVVLLLLSCSNTRITIWECQLNLALVVSFLSGVLYLARKKDWIWLLFGSLCMTFCYVGILLWELISPIWLFVPRLLMIPLIGLVLLLFLGETLIERCMVWSLGITSGEILHGLIMTSYGFQLTIGERSFFDLLFVGIAFIILLRLTVATKQKIDVVAQTIERKLKMRWNHE